MMTFSLKPQPYPPRTILGRCGMYETNEDACFGIVLSEVMRPLMQALESAQHQTTPRIQVLK